MAALFGLLVTLAFALLPLGRARDVPATALFREMGFEGRGLPRLVLCRRGARPSRCVLAVLAIWFSGDRRIASIFVGATVFAFVVLRSVGVCVQWLARQEPARALDRAAAGDRQHPPARRADAVGGAVARPGADAAGDAGADRRQSAPADLPAACRSGRRISSSSTSRAAEVDALRRADRTGRRRTGKLVRGADAARPHHGAERRRCRRRSACRPKAPGCCAATAA